ncbi:hypothetical protein DLM_0869 [Aquitalea magnusonii]|uniref:Nucleoid-associated protein n=1 Tax=Aquitalea magnusonii TaxID=332411 RepID=A0A3G9GCY1_9NEIS|nr:nucleoid-associated protein [Aquitalea magnusonii]BBF84509.1 hypothetical protein DLM_0869 [Aquitalea magnusonii]
MAEFDFCDMQIQRMVAHTVYARGKGNVKKDPDCSDELIGLDQESLDLLQLRIIGALGNRSHGVNMSIARASAESFMQNAAMVMGEDDATFINVSKQFARDLTEAQTNPRWPGGVLIVLSGRIGAPSKRFVAVIKAETDKGFNVVEEGGKIQLRLIKKMLLSETQRLYKVGILIELADVMAGHDGLKNADNYLAFLFDHLLTSSETGKAAAYFYDKFLGMSIATSSRHQTRVFFEESKSFISSSELSDEDRYTLREALRTELKNHVPTLNLEEFAERTFPEELRDAYIEHMTAKGFPSQSIVKDTEYIKHQLKKPRNVTFTSGVLIRVPAEHDFREMVDIQENVEGYTQVRIKGAVQAQE